MVVRVRDERDVREGVGGSERELPDDMRRSLERYRERPGRGGRGRGPDAAPGVSAAGAGGGRSGRDAVPPPRRRRGRHRGLKLIGLLLLVVVLALLALVLFWDRQLTRVNALRGYDGRPSSTAGTNWLVVGSDSRSDLTAQQKAQLATGDAVGSRTDTIMVVHTGTSQTSLISLPRDSYVPIAGHGRNKLNAAFSLGGPALLTRTVEEVTGLRIDHYAEVGFGGFAGMVDSVGGVRLCLPTALKDPKAGLDLPAGCQTLDGPQALGFVRTRAFANADLQRVVDQRMFLSALTAKAASPTTALNPFKSVPFVSQGVKALSVDNGTHLWNLASLGVAMRGLSSGGGVTATAPIASTPYVSGVGDVVMLDRTNALRMFRAVAAGEPIPSDLVSKK